MKALKFNFSHPFKGNACLINCSNINQRRILSIDTENRNDFDISVDGCEDGKWQVILEWEFDGRPFSYRQNFDIKSRRLCDQQL
jgi:hypothetical protein